MTQPGLFLGGKDGIESGNCILHYEPSPQAVTVRNSAGAWIKRFAYDDAGNIYAVGQITPAAGLNHWVVMKSLDGLSWEMIDTAATWHPKYSSTAVGVTTDAAGNVFVSGYALEKTGRSWRVRKGTPTASGFLWSETLVITGNAQGGEVLYVPPTQGKHNGGVYAVGYATSKNLSSWKVMRSGDAGSSWQSVDTWNPGKSTAAAASAIAVSEDGSIYVVGYDSGRDPSGWWMRRSTDGGLNWQVIGPKYSIGTYNQPTAVATDLWGNVYVAGYTGADGHVNWTVRCWNSATGAWEDWHPFYPATSRAEGLAVTILGEVYATGGVNGLGWVVQKLTP